MGCSGTCGAEKASRGLIFRLNKHLHVRFAGDDKLALRGTYPSHQARQQYRLWRPRISITDHSAWRLQYSVLLVRAPYSPHHASWVATGTASSTPAQQGGGGALFSFLLFFHEGPCDVAS